jgi:predicted CXXCH cytochrome family protein
VGALLVTATGLRALRRAVATDLATPRDLHGKEFAGSAACHRCHEDHDRSWHRTFHRTMTREVSARNAGAVLGDFSGATLRYGDVEARMDRDAGGAFRMTFTSIAGPGRVPVAAIVSRAIGSRRYQQYLTRIGDAEYRLPVAFHVEERRWFHMNGAFLFPDSSDADNRPAPRPSAAVEAEGTLAAFVDGLGRLGGASYARHVTRWNDNCVFCHNVAPNPGRDPATGRFRTEVAELGIACEACHGPGAEHARANRDPVRRYTLHLGGRSDPTIVNPSRLPPARSADLCGRCHGQRITDDIGRFLDHGDPFVPGDDLALWSAPLWQDTPLGSDRAPFAARFWADGTARLTAYEYQGLLQSRCAQHGTLTCTTCHGMHDGDPRGQLRPSATGDGACTGCHQELAAATAQARHSHHDAGGAGARCVACHMPRIVYGVLDIHRSHRIEVPDPARAAAAGRPDACTGCHADETAIWAAAAVRRLWGREARDEGAGPKTDDKTDDADDAGDTGDADPGGPLTRILAGDPIERAVAADALGRARAPVDAHARAVRAGLLLEVMVADDYPAVRHLAGRALGRLLPHALPALAAYDPAGPGDRRRRVADQIRAALPGEAVVVPDLDSVRRLRGSARAVAIEIGE